MRIVELKAENVKRLKAVQIRPDGDTVIIAGRNAQGKSSVLDAIWMALAGAEGAKETTRPIRDGEKQAKVALDLGDLTVARTWTEKGTTLVVSAADGARYPSPQKVLDELIGRLTFDPLAFAEASQKEQLATLLSVVDLPLDPEKVAMARQAAYESRTEANREVKRLEALLSEQPEVPADTPDEETSASELAAELEWVLRDERLRDELESAISDERAQIEELKRRLAVGEETLAALITKQQELGVGRDPIPLREQLAAVDATNALVRAKAERARISKEWSKMKEDADYLTARLAKIDEQKAKALADAKMPLEGLSFDDEGVLYNGVPFSQASASERLRASIAIAMALNPKIRVIRITDGSLLDSENLKMIEEMAGEHDFQVWLERVDDSGEVGITIEDGQVLGG